MGGGIPSLVVDVIWYVYVILKYGAIPLSAVFLGMAAWNIAYYGPHGARKALGYGLAAAVVLGAFWLINFVRTYVGDWADVAKPF